jgi:hypothetical protein
VKLCADISPPGGYEDLKSGVIQNTYVKAGCLVEFLEDRMKMAKIDQMADGILPIY